MKQTCYKVSVSDGGEGNKCKINALLERPSFEVSENAGWQKNEE